MQAQQFRAGMSGGLVATDIDGASTRYNGNGFHKIGVNIGALVTSTLTENLTGQLEMNFIQKGSLQPPDSNNMGYYKIAFSYVEIPVLVKRKIKFNIRKKPVNRVDLEGGISYGRMFHTVVVGSSNYNLPVNGKLFNYNDVSLFGGFDINLNKNLFFCFRYSNSVIPAIRRNIPNYNFTYTYNRGNNLVFQFVFKVLFGPAPEPKPV